MFGAKKDSPCKVGVMLADGFESIEAVAPIDILRRGGIEVTTVSCMPERHVISAQSIPVTADVMVADAQLESFDLIMIPGGMSTAINTLSATAKLDEALKAHLATRSVAAICAGPQVLDRFGLLEGRSVTCYPGCQTNFPAGVYTDASRVVVDGNLITACGPGAAIDFGLAILAYLKGQSVADSVAGAMLIVR